MKKVPSGSQAMSVGPIEELAGVAPALALGAERHHQLAVVGELVDDVQLIVEHPDVLLGIVRAHLDLVRTAAARRLEQLVVLRPPLHHLAVAIDDEDHVVVAALPAALRGRLAGRAQPVVVAGGAAARRVEHARRESTARRPPAAAARRAARSRCDRASRRRPRRPSPRSSRRASRRRGRRAAAAASSAPARRARTLPARRAPGRRPRVRWPPGRGGSSVGGGGRWRAARRHQRDQRNEGDQPVMSAHRDLQFVDGVVTAGAKRTWETAPRLPGRTRPPPPDARRPRDRAATAVGPLIQLVPRMYAPTRCAGLAPFFGRNFCGRPTWTSAV